MPRSTAVVIASAGRPQLLGRLLGDLAHQTSKNFTIAISVPAIDDLPQTPVADDVLIAFAQGASAQRNAAMKLVPEAEIIIFFDDDLIPREDYVEAVQKFMAGHPDIVAITGRVLLDGAAGDEINLIDGKRVLEESLIGQQSASWRKSRELYGCNFAIRPAMAPGEIFDERLPLYSWLEDHDLCRRLMRYGVVAKVDSCVAVHMGVKSGGRTAHERLGYSQVANPIYLYRKRSFPLWLMFRETIPRVAKNAILSGVGMQRDHRRRRLRGNFWALRDFVHGRVDPERIRDMPLDGGEW